MGLGYFPTLTIEIQQFMQVKNTSPMDLKQPQPPHHWEQGWMIGQWKMW